MKRTRNLLLFLLFFFLSCDYSLEDTQSYSQLENLVARPWSIRSLYINEHWVSHVGHAFEPNSGQWENRWVRWLWFDYSKDKTYEYRSDNRRTPLGQKENFQPETGYWILDENDSLLIHNKGTFYETKYKIVTINDTLFIRDYERTILATNDTSKWKVGDRAIYREILEIRTGPCCD